MADRPAADEHRDMRKVFTDRVKAIDPLFKTGNLESFWPVLRELVQMAPDRRDLSLKKSHYLASLAARSLLRNDPSAALAFLDFADCAIRSEHLTPFLVREREEFRKQVEAAMGPGKRRADRSKSTPR